MTLADLYAKAERCLSRLISEQFGEGFSQVNVDNFRRFYLTHRILQTSAELGWSQYVALMSVKDDQMRSQLENEVFEKNLPARGVKA